MKGSLKKLKKLTAIALIALLAFGSSISSFATIIVPELNESTHDPVKLGYSTIKFDKPKDGEKTTDDMTIEVDFYSSEKFVNWESSLPIEFVYVKGGDEGYMYHYPSGSEGDTGLRAPNNKGGKQPGISHVTFYYKIEAEPDPDPEPDKGELVIRKVWLNKYNEPMETDYTSIDVALYIDGVLEEDVITLEAAHDWTVTLTDLDFGKVYSVVEISDLGHFETTYSAPIELDDEMLDAELVITNKCTYEEPVYDPKIEVTKSVTPGSAQLTNGTATFHYTITLKNTGNVTLDYLSIEDDMTGPTGAIMTYSPMPDAFYGNFAYFDLERDLEPDETEVFHYSVTVNMVGTYDNIVAGYGFFMEEAIYDEAEESAVVTQPSTQPTTETPTNPTTETSTETPTNPTTETSTETPTNPTTETSTETPTNPTTETSTETPTNPTTETSTETPTNPTTETSTETPTNPTSVPVTQSATEDDEEVVAFIPTTESSTEATTEAATEASTEAATEAVTEEEIPLGAPDPDEILPEETPDEEVVLDEEVPLADALPQTGQLPMELYYGIGSVISLMGIAIRRKNK